MNYVQYTTIEIVDARYFGRAQLLTTEIIIFHYFTFRE